jgi:RNA polymerase sigma-70 factor, ECF subfamily
MSERDERDDEAAAFLRGDRGQLASTERAVRRAVRSFQLGARDLEDDLVQETLHRVLTSLRGGRFRGTASLSTYAASVARHTCLEYVRRRHKHIDVDLDRLPAGDLRSAPEESFLWTEEHLRNLKAFAGLTRECRTILRLICVDGVSYRDMARRLGVSEGALKSRVHRCRLACREAAGLPSLPDGDPQRKGRP